MPAIAASDHAVLLRIVRALALQPGMTRAELTERIGVSRPTVSAALRSLVDRGFVEQRVVAAAFGRPPMRVFLTGSTAVSLGVEITDAEVHVGAFDIGGVSLARTCVPSSARPAELTATLIRTLVDKTAARTAYNLGVGVAITTRACRDPDAVAELVSELRERTGLAVSAENAANAAAAAEHRFGAGLNCDNMIYLHLSHRISAGLILDNRLYRGATGLAGDIGHLTVDPANGVAPVSEWTRLAAAGDGRASQLIADAGTALGSATAAATNLLNPRRVVIGGQLAEAGRPLLRAIENGIARDASRPSAAATRVVRGQLGRNAVVRGLAHLQALRELPALLDLMSVH